jgi:hypothetical protein
VTCLKGLPQNSPGGTEKNRRNLSAKSAGRSAEIINKLIPSKVK